MNQDSDNNGGIEVLPLQDVPAPVLVKMIEDLLQAGREEDIVSLGLTNKALRGQLLLRAPKMGSMHSAWLQAELHAVLARSEDLQMCLDVSAGTTTQEQLDQLLTGGEYPCVQALHVKGPAPEPALDAMAQPGGTSDDNMDAMIISCCELGLAFPCTQSIVLSGRLQLVSAPGALPPWHGLSSCSCLTTLKIDPSVQLEGSLLQAGQALAQAAPELVRLSLPAQACALLHPSLLQRIQSLSLSTPDQPQHQGHWPPPGFKPGLLQQAACLQRVSLAFDVDLPLFRALASLPALRHVELLRMEYTAAEQVLSAGRPARWLSWSLGITGLTLSTQQLLALPVQQLDCLLLHAVAVPVSGAGQARVAALEAMLLSVPTLKAVFGNTMVFTLYTECQGLAGPGPQPAHPTPLQQLESAMGALGRIAAHAGCSVHVCPGHRVAVNSDMVQTLGLHLGPRLTCLRIELSFTHQSFWLALAAALQTQLTALGALHLEMEYDGVTGWLHGLRQLAQHAPRSMTVVLPWQSSGSLDGLRAEFRGHGSHVQLQ